MLRQNMENIRNGNIQPQNTIQFKPVELVTPNDVTINVPDLSLNPPTVTPSTDDLSDRPSLLDGSFTKLPVNSSSSTNSNSEGMREIINKLEGQNVPIHSPSTDPDTQELLEIMNSMKAKNPLSGLQFLTPEQKELLLKDPQPIVRD